MLCFSLNAIDDPLHDEDMFAPTVFGEGIAILAGDALLTIAFEIVSKAKPAPRYDISILLHEIAQHEHQILRPRLGLQDSRSDWRSPCELDDNFQADEKVNIYSRTLSEGFKIYHHQTHINHNS